MCKCLNFRNMLFQLSDIKCNVYGYDTTRTTMVSPLYRSKFKSSRIVNLLYLKDGERFHYVLIQNLPSLLKTKTKHNNTLPMCIICLQHFSSTRVLLKHWLACSSEDGQFESMPNETIIKFKNWKYRQPNILTTYAGLNIIIE